MRRTVGLLLVLHGLAHAGAGMWVTASAPLWIATMLWWLAIVGFIAAGTGLIGEPWLDRRWRIFSSMAAAASLGLIAMAWQPILMIGAAIDGALLLDVIPFVHRSLARGLGVPEHPTHRRLARAGSIVSGLLVAYVTALLVTRPWHMRWGVTERELAMHLTGDPIVVNNGYRIGHGVTIHAAADSVWPWLVQLGQDRAGFYSYDWLERLIGDPIRNANRIVPEWQSLEVGDLVRAAPPNYLGGLFGHELGWRVAQLMPGRAMVLEGWGAFVILPLNDSTSRLIVRTRGESHPSLAAVPFAPIGLLVFEPAHFIMERGMLLGIKARAERAVSGERRSTLATRFHG